MKPTRHYYISEGFLLKQVIRAYLKADVGLMKSSSNVRNYDGILICLWNNTLIKEMKDE